MTKAYNKNDVKTMKKTYIKAPYKGKPYMDYLRDKNKDKYLNYLKEQIKHLNTNEPTGNNLGIYYNNLVATMFNNYEEFFDDLVADGSVLNDIYYFWLPTRLMTGKDVYEHTKNILNDLKANKKDIIEKNKQQLMTKNEKVWFLYQKQRYFSFNTNKLIKMSKKASDLYSLYAVKLNQDGAFINIREATYKDVRYRLQEIEKKYSDKKYARTVNQARKIDNGLIRIYTDCEIAVDGHLEVKGLYEHSNACDIVSFNKFKRDKNILNHLPKYKDNQIFKDNILNIFKITEQIVKNNKCTQAMNDKQQELYIPLCNIKDILRKKNLETIM